VSRSASVSIVIPTFDRVSLLRQAVASVMEQSRDDWELIIVDDGSRDGTATYVGALGDPRVELVTVPHCGNPARLRNLGIARASAPWVAFLDSDDLWSPDKLARHLGAVDQHPECRWSYTAWTLIDGAGAELRLERFPIWSECSGWIARELLSHSAKVACPTVLARRELLQAAGGFDESLDFCEDFDLWLRLATRSPALAVSQRLTKVRLHADSNTWHRPEVNLAFVRVYGNFRRDSARQSIELQLCDQQQAAYWVRYGREVWGPGRRGDALLAFLRALRRQPRQPELWSAVSRKLLGAFRSASSSARSTSSAKDGRDAT
jgi:glycosyltransferase involved in cell wall biosynthesis